MGRSLIKVGILVIIATVASIAQADLITVDTSQSTLTLESGDTAGDSGPQTWSVSTFPFIQRLNTASPDGAAGWEYDPDLTDTELEFENYGTSSNSSEATYSTLGAHIIFTANTDIAFEVVSWGYLFNGYGGTATYEMSLTDQTTATPVFDEAASGTHPVNGGDGNLTAGHVYDLEFTGSFTTYLGGTADLGDNTYMTLTAAPEPACASFLAIGVVLMCYRRRRNTFRLPAAADLPIPRGVPPSY